MDARGLYQVLIQVFEADLCTSKFERVLPRRVSAALGPAAQKKAPPGRSQLIDHESPARHAGTRAPGSCDTAEMLAV